MVGDADVIPTMGPGRLRHLADGGFSVGVVGVAVEDSANVGEYDELRQRSAPRGVDLAESLAQLGLDEREPSGLIDRRFVGRRDECSERITQTIAIDR